MPARCAVFIDAGYLLASAATRVTGTSLRSGIHVEFGKLIEGIRRQAEEVSGMPVLRVHWYDSARNGVPDPQQQRIGELPRVKLRLGRFGIDGQQKGVDLRLGLDLVTHARNQASEVFLLVSGDDDFTEAVEEAQAHGVEVLVLAAPDAGGGAHAVSRHLRRAADELHVIDGALVDEAVLKVERPRAAEGDEIDAVEVDVDILPAGDFSDAGGLSDAGARDDVEVEAEDRAGAGPEDVTTDAEGALEPTSVPSAGKARTVVPVKDPVPGPRAGGAPSGAPAEPAAPAAPAAADGPLPGPGPRPEPAPPATVPAAPQEPRPAAPQEPRPTTPAAPTAPRTPKDIAATMRRPDGDGVPLPLDAVARTGTFADEFHTTVAAVVGRVLSSLALSSTPRAWKALELGRPSIPRDVDKALLIDVTAAMGVVDLSDLERHEIREAFWQAYDALMAAARS